MRLKQLAAERTLWKDPNILPHHDGLIPRNQKGCIDGGKIPPARILAERPDWRPADIAYYLGYPDDVIYDPEGGMSPMTLYALNRIVAAERLMEATDTTP